MAGGNRRQGSEPEAISGVERMGPRRPAALGSWRRKRREGEAIMRKEKERKKKQSKRKKRNVFETT